MFIISKKKQNIGKEWIILHFISEHLGYVYAATTPETPVGSTKLAISAVTLMISSGYWLLIWRTLITSFATIAVLAT